METPKREGDLNNTFAFVSFTAKVLTDSGYGGGRRSRRGSSASIE